MPFTPRRIKFLLLEKSEFDSLTDIAESWQIRFEELSMCIRQVPGRVYPALRLRICEVIGQSVDTVFGKHPLTSALLSNKQTKRRRAA